jgi:formiminotetrahydrofolate cyclodeaminase
MNSVDKISRETKNLLESAKDALATNIVTAARSKNVTIDESQLPVLINLVNITIDETFQKSLPVYQNSIKGLVKNSK